MINVLAMGDCWRSGLLVELVELIVGIVGVAVVVVVGFGVALKRNGLVGLRICAND